MPDGVSVPTILALAGVAFWIAALLGGIKIREIEFPPLSKNARALVFIAGTVLISLGVVLEVRPKSLLTPSPTETPTPTLTCTPTETPALTPTPTPTNTPTPTPTPSPTPTPECRFDNLLNCSRSVPFGEGDIDAELTTDGLEVDFNNFGSTTTAVAFVFSPSLDMRGFTRLELIGSSTQGFSFYVEFKRKDDTEPIYYTASQSFPRSDAPYTLQVPLEYDGDDLVAEIVLNFNESGDSSILTITSIRLLE
jgi:hypothetical protein